MPNNGPALAIPLQPVDHVLGAHDARLTLVQYGDFECPYCREAAPVVKLLMTSHAGQMRYAFRHYPLEEVHPHALLAAQAAEAAGAQGKFWPMHDLLFADPSHLRRPSLLARAERLELDMTRFTVELDDEVYLQRVREHIEGGRASGVRATPTFFLDGALVDVSFGLRALSDAVARALRSPTPPAK